MVLFFRLCRASGTIVPLEPVNTLDSHPPANVVTPVATGVADLVLPSDPIEAYRVAITEEAQRLRGTRDQALDLLDAAYNLPSGEAEHAEDALLRTIHANAALAKDKAAKLREMLTDIRDAPCLPRPELQVHEQDAAGTHG